MTIRASSLPRLAKCPASHHLPQVQEESDDSLAGVAIHAFLADALVRGRDAALVVVAKAHYDRCAAIDFSKLPAKVGQVATEMALEWEGYTGTADVIGLTDDAVLVCDWKGPWASLDPASTNLQTGLYLVAACSAYHRTKGYVVIVRVKDDGSTWQDMAAFDETGLDLMRMRITAVGFDVERSKTNPRNQYAIGDHCRYCPGVMACPAHHALAASLGRGEIVPFQALELSADNVMRAHHAVKAGEKILANAKAAIRTFLEHGGIAEADGKRLVIQEVGRESLDGTGTFHELTELYGDEVARAACTVETSKEAVEDAIAPIAKAKDEPVSALMRLTMERLRAAGHVTKKTFTKIVERNV